MRHSYLIGIPQGRLREGYHCLDRPENQMLPSVATCWWLAYAIANNQKYYPYVGNPFVFTAPDRQQRSWILGLVARNWGPVMRIIDHERQSPEEWRAGVTTR